jgi:hypothetical protein
MKVYAIPMHGRSCGAETHHNCTIFIEFKAGAKSFMISAELAVRAYPYEAGASWQLLRAAYIRFPLLPLQPPWVSTLYIVQCPNRRWGGSVVSSIEEEEKMNNNDH